MAYLAQPERAVAYTATFIDWCARKESKLLRNPLVSDVRPDADERIRATVGARI